VFTDLHSVHRLPLQNHHGITPVFIGSIIGNQRIQDSQRVRKLYRFAFRLVYKL
jgi:hypothetical protein